MASSVRISDRGRDLLGQLVQETGSTTTDLLDAALESYRRQRFLEQVDLAYGKLAEDPIALKKYHDEMKSFDGTLDDGLQSFPA